MQRIPAIFGFRLVMSCLGALAQATQSQGSWSALAVIGPGASSCALDMTKSAWCWGWLVAENGSLAGFNTPQLVDRSRIWSALAVGNAVACGVLAGGGPAAGEVYCWGENSRGLLDTELPNPPATQYDPYRVHPGVGPWAALSIGTDSACGILTNGSLLCWGSNESGQLGAGHIKAVKGVQPVHPGQEVTWSQVTVGAGFACGIKRQGASLWCWGSSNFGELGSSIVPMGMNSSVPMMVDGNNTWAAVSAGKGMACGITSDRLGWCWGADIGPSPIPIPGDLAWANGAVGNGTVCATTLNNEVICWGVRDGTLRELPNSQSLGGNVTSLGLGLGFGCLHITTGSIICWGDNERGQLGNGEFSSAASSISSPSMVLPPKTYVASPPSPLLAPSTEAAIGGSGGSSGAPVAAIVGAVLGAVLAVAASATLIVLGRRKHWWGGTPAAAPIAASNGLGPSCETPLGTDVTGGCGSDPSTVNRARPSHQISEKTVSPLDSHSSRATDNLLDDMFLSWTNKQYLLDTILHQHAQSQATNLVAGDASATQPVADSEGSDRTAALSEGGLSPSSGTANRANSSSRRRELDLRPWLVDFGALRLQRLIGIGSFGKVYLAVWNETPVAVKILVDTQRYITRDELLSLSSPILESLKKEARFMAQLRHPCVLQFMGICTGPPAMVTEYCAKGSLTDVLKAGVADPQKAAELTWSRRLAMALDAATGMLHLHSQTPPILHRDLKSPNLCVDAWWRVKVADFNLSRVLEHMDQIGGYESSTGAGVLNPRWLSPEVMESHKPGPAADVFAMGVVLWELVAWAIPYLGEDFWTVVQGVRRGRRPEFPQLGAVPGPDVEVFEEIRGSYESLVRWCWAQAPEDRPTFAEITPALRQLLAQVTDIELKRKDGEASAFRTLAPVPA